MAAMYELIVNLFVMLLSAYAGAGLLFAIAFVTWGIERVDAQAKGAGLGFRLIVVPGVAALWPLMLRRWMRDERAPIERTPHR